MNDEKAASCVSLYKRTTGWILHHNVCHVAFTHFCSPKPDAMLSFVLFCLKIFFIVLYTMLSVIVERILAAMRKEMFMLSDKTKEVSLSEILRGRTMESIV